MMIKYRVHEVAKDLQVSSRDVIGYIRETTGEERKHMTALQPHSIISARNDSKSCKKL